MTDLTNVAKWWNSKKEEKANDISSFVDHLDKDQKYRSNDNLKFARLYGNYEITGLDAYRYTQVESSAVTKNRVTLNIVQSMIDTVVSKITKNKPRPTFLTSGGNWTLQQKAKKLTKYMDGVFSATEFYQKAALAFLDACIFGTGAIKIYAENGNVKAERVFIEELKIDDTEAFYGKPRQLHQVKYIQKDILKNMFPKKEKEIEAADSNKDQYTMGQSSTALAMVKVVESWHLPSGENATDGRHTITVSDLTLFDEIYTKQFFPFVFFKWGVRPVGFFGQGLAEQLTGLQVEINKILRTIQVSMHLVSIPKLLVEASSKIVSAQLSNKIGGIIKYAGTPPQYAPLGSIPPELFSHLDRLYSRAYEVSGISQLSAQSLKPSGLDSGKALREFNDIESERFLAVSRRYEEAFMTAADIVIDISKDLYAHDTDLTVKVKGKKFIETIKWSDVDLADDQYMMDVFPTSVLSQTPAGRLQDVQELIQAGFLGKEDGLKLLDFPDLESSINMLNADSNNLDKIIESMIEKGKYISPEPYQNLENAVRKVQQAYLMHRMEGAPDSKLELLRRYMEEAQNLIIKSQTPTAAEQAAQLAASGGGAAAAEVAQNAQLGSAPLNPLVEGDIILDEEAALAQEAALDPNALPPIV